MRRELDCVRQEGFTLVELMVVVAIISILMAIGIPAYRDYVASARRADATAMLVEVAQFMERNFSNSGRYDRDANDVGVTLPVALRGTPRGATDGTQYYAVTLPVANLSDTTFTAQAVPVNAQATDPCGTLTLNHRGQRTASGVSASRPITTCWR